MMYLLFIIIIIIAQVCYAWRIDDSYSITEQNMYTHVKCGQILPLITYLATFAMIHINESLDFTRNSFDFHAKNGHALGRMTTDAHRTCIINEFTPKTVFEADGKGSCDLVDWLPNQSFDRFAIERCNVTSTDARNAQCAMSVLRAKFGRPKSAKQHFLICDIPNKRTAGFSRHALSRWA